MKKSFLSMLIISIINIQNAFLPIASNNINAKSIESFQTLKAQINQSQEDIINPEDIDINYELEKELKFYEDKLSKCNDKIEKDKISSLIKTINKLLISNQNNNSTTKAKAKSYDIEVASINAVFTKLGYVLASELLLYAFTNTELDSVYTPINKDIILNSSVYESIKTNNNEYGELEFPKSGTTADKDLYYSIHSFRYLKSPSNRVINLEDRYDYAQNNDYPTIQGIANNWMYNAQEDGALTPYFITISFNYNEQKIINSTEDVNIGDTRLYEKAFGLGKNESRTFNLTFKRSGYKVIQTMGMVDMVAKLYDSNNNLIAYSDDQGSGSNPYILLNATSSTKYKLVLNGFDDEKFGATRLIITNSFYDKEFKAEKMDKFENIYAINNENFTWYSYVGEHHSHLLRLFIPTKGRYQVDATSEFDNYLYILDPRSGFPTRNEDKNNNGGEGTNARIIKDLNAKTNYLVIYSQYNPSASFANYDSGDDLQIKITQIKSF